MGSRPAWAAGASSLREPGEGEGRGGAAEAVALGEQHLARWPVRSRLVILAPERRFRSRCQPLCRGAPRAARQRSSDMSHASASRRIRAASKLSYSRITDLIVPRSRYSSVIATCSGRRTNSARGRRPVHTETDPQREAATRDAGQVSVCAAGEVGDADDQRAAPATAHVGVDADADADAMRRGAVAEGVPGRAWHQRLLSMAPASRTGRGRAGRATGRPAWRRRGRRSVGGTRRRLRGPRPGPARRRAARRW